MDWLTWGAMSLDAHVLTIGMLVGGLWFLIGFMFGRRSR